MTFAKMSWDQWEGVREIYLEAFPKAERKPLFSLKRSVRSGKAEIFTAAEDGVLLGFIVVIPYRDMLMVDYLAVSAKIRSRGTGSLLLQEICRRFSDKRIALLIERLDSAAPNSAQRESRRKFYLKNGFVSSDIFIGGSSGEMEILRFGGAFSSAEYLDLQQYALGRLFFRLSGISVLPAPSAGKSAE